MKVAIHGKKFDGSVKEVIQSLFDILKSKGVELTVSSTFSEILEKNRVSHDSGMYKKGDNLGGFDAFITLGGDGTLLEAVTHIGKTEVPILGINTGRLGFLATIAKESIEGSINELLEQNYGYDERSLLTLNTQDRLFNGYNFALNDFAILKKDTSSMIVVNAYINGEFLNSYWADGVIVATPTGSTGYSMSCGGPLVLPHSENFIITPVSPHNLTVRPIVVPDNSELSFTIEGRTNNYLVALDSRLETVDDTITLNIKKADFKARLIQLSDNNYFKTLRQKLNWGLDVRN
ncbi:NAD kinase [Fulvivirga lutea]|uniref:NAD kinase n=1 Tax=Fulvivirga lutea TaxID=2810512 RepID=A0A974WHP6_9BACT|nr:NAD kinase [Fulvivirga lutea]QSE98581.1 NAD kinase [Fulvivirga lutea]